jgi:transposase
VNETLPQIFEGAERCNGVVLFEDEAVFQQAGTMSRTWAPVGKGTELKSEPCRESVKVFGAVNVTYEDRPGWHFLFEEMFNAETFVKFLNQLTRYYGERKVFLILDNARYHRANIVKEWHSKLQERISFHFLPPYSPELNAAEYVWRATKRKATHNIYFRTKLELHDKLFRRFNRYQGNPRSLKTTVGSFSRRRAS